MRKTTEFDAAAQHVYETMSKAFTDARLEAKALAAFPGVLPETLEKAYAIQSASIDNWPDEVAGWKVGMVPEPHKTIFAAERLAGPIFARSIVHSPGCEAITMPIYPGGFAAVEAEFVLVLGQTIPPHQRDYSDEDLAALIKDMHIGIEIASSPLSTINQIGPAAIVSDFGNNAGLVVGPAIKNGVSRALDSLHVKVDVDGITVGKTTAKSIPGGILQALRFLLEVCAKRDITLEAGEFISTGAVTGVHEVDLTSRSRVEFADLGWFDVKFDSIQPYR